MSGCRSGEDIHAAGLDHAAAGRLSEAIAAFEQAVRQEPRRAQARLNLGVTLARAGRVADAEAQFTIAVSQVPDYLDAHLNLGKTLALQGRHVEAAKSFRRALAIDPTHVDVLSSLGLSLTHARRAESAVVVLRQAVRFDPGFAGAWSNLGFALSVLGRYAEADVAFRTALRLDPSLSEAHVNRGNALKEQNRLDEAIACYDLAIALNDDSGSARWNRSLALLQQGDFARGWVAYESRWQRPGAASRQRAMPSDPALAWDGSSPAGRTILVRPEQGLGDVVMFSRYVMHLKQAGARVLLQAPPPLVTVLATCPWVDRVLPEGQPLPPFDAHVPCMSLPWLFGTVERTVPAAVPYLHADPDRTAAIRLRLGDFDGCTVGIVWQGNPHHPWDQHRSVPLQRLAPLAQVPGVRVVSLQRGPGTEQLSGCPWVRHDILGSASNEADAVADLAAAIAAVDLIVTVDTLPAHLAGAMARPVWVLLSTMVDWRWMNDRHDSPWYPTMRLFRQSARDEWDPVVQAVAQALAQHVRRPVENVWGNGDEQRSRTGN